jgi:hypothetical protein
MSNTAHLSTPPLLAGSADPHSERRWLLPISVNARRSLPNGSAPNATVPPGFVDEVALSVEITVDLQFEQA